MSAATPTTTATATATNRAKKNLYFPAAMNQDMTSHFFALQRRHHGNPLLASSGSRSPS